MKKIIKVKNKKVIKALVEDFLKVGNVEDEKKLLKRVRELQRIAGIVKNAVKKAQENGREEEAKKLEDRLTEIETLINKYNIDEIEAEIDTTASTDTKDTKDSEEDVEDTEEDKDEKESDKKDDSKDDTEAEDEIDSEQDTSQTNPEQDAQNSDSQNDKTDSEAKDDSETKDSTENPEDEDVDTKDKDNQDSADSKDPIEKSSDKQDSEDNNLENSDSTDTQDDTDEEDSEEDQDETETDDSPVKDPFADEDDIPDFPFGQGTQEPRDATLKDIIKQLKKLSPEAKRGAIAALKELIGDSNLGESLTEAARHLRSMTDDEFGDYINSTLDLISDLEDLTVVDDIEKRKANIQAITNDPNLARELAAEVSVEAQKDYQKKKAREKEKAKYSSFKSLEDFKLNFYSAINNQVEILRQELQTYDEINNEYESENIIMKADVMKEVEDEAIPSVDVYFDVSGSWGEEEIKIGQKAIASVKAFEDAGELKMNIFYFSNGVGTTIDGTHSQYGYGTHAWSDILQNIKVTGAKNVLIMTDSDMNGLAPNYGSLKVEGCVWYLWKNGEAAPNCAARLTGKAGTWQYMFKA